MNMNEHFITLIIITLSLLACSTNVDAAASTASKNVVYAIDTATPSKTFLLEAHTSNATNDDEIGTHQARII